MDRVNLNDDFNPHSVTIAEARKWAWEHAMVLYPTGGDMMEAEARAVRLADFVMTGTFAAS